MLSTRNITEVRSLVSREVLALCLSKEVLVKVASPWNSFLLSSATRPSAGSLSWRTFDTSLCTSLCTQERLESSCTWKLPCANTSWSRNVCVLDLFLLSLCLPLSASSTSLSVSGDKLSNSVSFVAFFSGCLHLRPNFSFHPYLVAGRSEECCRCL